jgi:phosphoglucomutase
MKILSVPTQPIEGQKTGTSGLRKKVSLIESTPNYIENWIQSLMTALEGSQEGKTFVIGGDGRYLNDTAMIAAIEILFAHGVHQIIVGQNGLLSTPSVSNLIRQRKAFGGIIMTASHNPAGKDGDWGIKFNCSNGEPAPEKVTDKIYAASLTIKEIRRADSGLQPSDLGSIGIRTFAGDKMLHIVDPVTDYIALMKIVFDFEAIKKFLHKQRSPAVLFDGMHAVTGIYGQRIFGDEFGLDKASCLQNASPSPDFNKGHPDPNLVYAHDLVERMMGEDPPMFGAASDGDGDRNMIMGAKWFVTPSDSLAIIAHYALEAIPYFARNGLKGVARSMPTSRAVDAVAAKKGFKCFETPTGWKYFGNLMDGGLANLCGEESFGTGADHIREKDGIWAILAWLSVLEFVNRNSSALIGVREINEKHWDLYGRHYYSRCDYEECDSVGANRMMEHIRASLRELEGKDLMKDWTVSHAQEYEYKDPVDGSEAKKQGFIISFTNGSRLVYRLSGTGSAGATIRVYMEQFVKDWRAHTIPSLDKGPLMELSKIVSKLEEFTGRTAPTVIT